jgi:arylsulfatase A-like enzyme
MKKRPNIIVVLNDDHGPWAVGCYGNKEIKTPNLDRLAAEGMRFDNMFCVSPVCSPARASILTGRIPSQHGVHDWIREGNAEQEGIDYLEGHRAYTDILAENGYTCGISGKWHLGNSVKPQKSFEHWYVHETGGGPYYGAPMFRDGKLVHEEKYITDVITDDALDFMDENANGEKPFYLSVHYTAPHSPWKDNHPQEIVDSYDDCPFESCPQEPKHPDAISLSDHCLGNRDELKGYFAAVTAMDGNLGRILEKLDTLGIRENTLIFFSSDNGFSCGHHGFWGKGNGTFPLNMYENSVRVPTIASQPGIIPESTVCDSLLSHYDFMPTLLEYLGMSELKDDSLPGKSFAPLLKGDKGEIRENVVIYDEYGPVRMVRTKEWKYIHRYPYGPHELYNLAEDPDERRNLINEEAFEEKKESLRGMLNDWFFKYVDPAIDGAREPVTGAGQLNLAGHKGKGKQAFAELS